MSITTILGTDVVRDSRAVVNSNFTHLEDTKVTGPASATNNVIALFDGTTGKLLKESDATFTTPLSVSEFNYLVVGGNEFWGIERPDGTRLAIFEDAGWSSTTASTAVNHLFITNSTTGNPVGMYAYGDDTNVDINLTAKGTGKVVLGTDVVNVTETKTPASATAAGTTGDIAWDADYIYVCTATNTWKRTGISTW